MYPSFFGINKNGNAFLRSMVTNRVDAFEHAAVFVEELGAAGATIVSGLALSDTRMILLGAVPATLVITGPHGEVYPPVVVRGAADLREIRLEAAYVESASSPALIAETMSLIVAPAGIAPKSMLVLATSVPSALVTANVAAPVKPSRSPPARPVWRPSRLTGGGTVLPSDTAAALGKKRAARGDRSALPPGESFDDRIRTAIEESDLLVALK